MSADQDITQSLNDEFETLAREGAAFLESLKDVEKRASAHHEKTGGWKAEKHFFSARQGTKVQHLQDKFTKLGNRLLPALQSSPLLDASDVRNTRERLRAIRGALQLENHAFDREHGVWTVFLSDMSDAQENYRSLIRGVRELSPMLAPSTDELPSAIVSRRSVDVQQYRPNSAFIMMHIDDSIGKIEDVKRGIQTVCKEFGIEARRADDIEHSDTITKRILDEIATSEFLIADLTGERPSVYYEVGYAHAIGKRVIMYREEGTKLHFDLLVHNVPTYHNVTDLTTKLRNRLEAMTGRVPSE